VLEADGSMVDEARFPGRQGRLLFAYLATRVTTTFSDSLAAALHI
jgi:hypothetical protein